MKKERVGLKDAFSFLISQKKWRKKISRASLADHYAGRFRKGLEVPEDRIREFLIEAGYCKIQDELWEVNKLSDNDIKTHRYFVYALVENEKKIIISDVELLNFESKSSRLEARKKAIQEITGQIFSNDAKSEEVKSYIHEHLYNTKEWENYQILYENYENEVIQKDIRLVYELDVTFAKTVLFSSKIVYKILKDWCIDRANFKSRVISDVSIVFPPLLP